MNEEDNDAVLITFNPPVPGKDLYVMVKAAAQKSGYEVLEEIIDKRSLTLRRMVYDVDQEKDSVEKRVQEQFNLTLRFSEDVLIGLSGLTSAPKSTLYMEIKPDTTYFEIMCHFSPLDHNAEHGAESIKVGKATPLDTFVMALHEEYRERSAKRSSDLRGSDRYSEQ